jgi:methylglutaconyl-CoA hydratase
MAGVHSGLEMEATVTVEDHQRRGVLTVSLNRPEHHNALNRALVRELTETISTKVIRGQTRVVILAGHGKSFCAGADLQEVLENSSAGYEKAMQDGLALYDLLYSISRCPAPVIGRIDGWAIGGGMGLVSCCDLVVATERARFGFSEVRLGLIPAIITPFVLSRIHPRDARQLYLTGQRFDAQRAREIGLVDRVVADKDLDDQVEAWVKQLLQGAPGAQAAVKALLGGIKFRSPEEIREYTSSLFADRVVSGEGREGVAAFSERRRPAWDDSE